MDTTQLKKIIKESVWDHLMDYIPRMSDEFALEIGREIAEDVVRTVERG